MDERSISDMAHERASRRAPPPPYDPIYAGWAGEVVFGLPVMIFMGLAGLPDDSHPLALGIVLCLGFLVPFGFLKYQQHLHDKAWLKEYKELREQYPSSPP
jgi:hypothetical protein